MALRIAASLSKRLDGLAAVARAQRVSVPGRVIQCGTDELDARNERLFEALGALPRPERGGYLLVPPILPVDEWEAIALSSQLQLERDTSEWLGPPPDEPELPDPMDVTHRYKPDPARVQR